MVTDPRGKLLVAPRASLAGRRTLDICYAALRVWLQCRFPQSELPHLTCWGRQLAGETNL
jgi:hypothetical protein